MDQGNNTEPDVSADEQSSPPPPLPDTDTASSGQTVSAPGPTLEWRAVEFISHEKSAGWYGLLVLVTIVLVGLLYLLTRDEISAGTILIMMILFGVFAARKPRTLDFRLDDSGLQIGTKHYSYQEFRSFALVREGDHESILFMPMKRFMPLVSIYCPPEHKDAILGTLNQHLPYEAREPAPVDKLMSKIHF